MKYTPDEIAELLKDKPHQPHYIAAMVRKAVEAERERCAQVCESFGGNGAGYYDGSGDGDGSGSGCGYDDGYGYGSGDGNGTGCGYSNGYGDGGGGNGYGYG